MSEYQPLKWQVVVDGLGYSSVHETDEDGKPGDLVAHTYGDHINLIGAAPALLAAAEKALNYITNTEGEWGITLDSGDALRAAIALARFDAVGDGM